jgi:hypothetical protein
MNRRRIIATAVVLAGIAAAWFASAGAARMKPADRVLHVGDTVRVAGTSTRCAVARRSGAVMIECLPTSPTAGSYATVAGDKRVFVVRFRTPHVAQTVFHAYQHRTAVTCR